MVNKQILGNDSGFEIYLMSTDLKDKNMKKGKLLHYAGPEVQDIYFTFLHEALLEGETVYTQCVKKWTIISCPR